MAGALNALGVQFLRGGQSELQTRATDPIALIANLAMSDEARLRLALIPLFMQRPQIGSNAAIAIKYLDHSAATVLRCYYTAAFFLQQKYAQQLGKLLNQIESLPDLFAEELGLPSRQSPAEGLALLAARQSQLSGRAINWQGTYEHAARRLLRQLELRQKWTASK